MFNVYTIRTYSEREEEFESEYMPRTAICKSNFDRADLQDFQFSVEKFPRIIIIFLLNDASRCSFKREGVRQCYVKLIRERTSGL